MANTYYVWEVFWVFSSVRSLSSFLKRLFYLCWRSNWGSSNDSQAVWPDLAKFHHFGIVSKGIGNFLRVYLVFGILLNLLGKFLHCANSLWCEWKNICKSGHTVSKLHWGGCLGSQILELFYLFPNFLPKIDISNLLQNVQGQFTRQMS